MHHYHICRHYQGYGQPKNHNEYWSECQSIFNSGKGQPNAVLVDFLDSEKSRVERLVKFKLIESAVLGYARSLLAFTD